MKCFQWKICTFDRYKSPQCKGIFLSQKQQQQIDLEAHKQTTWKAKGKMKCTSLTGWHLPLESKDFWIWRKCKQWTGEKSTQQLHCISSGMWNDWCHGREKYTSVDLVVCRYNGAASILHTLSRSHTHTHLLKVEFLKHCYTAAT